MFNKYLIITSIADSNNKVLRQYASESKAKEVGMIVIGDLKSPSSFSIPHCDFYSVERQKNLKFEVAKLLPYNHYSRKNIGYLVAISNEADIIIETDDDNFPFPAFWHEKNRLVDAHNLNDCGWVNVYKHFTDNHIWPRGFSLEHILDEFPLLKDTQITDCPIQQGLADENPDVDALFRLTQQLPVSFNKSNNLALGKNSICPFNSQNTTWFKEAFPLLYLPSYCSFRMTDIWRSFIAQRIAWEYDWSILFHNSTVWQERNDHNLMKDFTDEIPGYLHNHKILKEIQDLNLESGKNKIIDNLVVCYQKLIDLDLIDSKEMALLEAWAKDLSNLGIVE